MRLVIEPPQFAIGWTERLFVTAPAAGQPFRYTADGRFTECIRAIRYVFTASAVAGGRFVRVGVTDADSKTVTDVPGGSNVVASNNVTVNLTVGAAVGAYGSSGFTEGYIPHILLPPGWSWTATAFGGDAGDTFTGIVVLTQRFPNDASMRSAIG